MGIVIAGYVWCEQKRRGAQHILGDDGHTICQAEKGAIRPFDGFSEHQHKRRRMCKMCAGLSGERAVRGRTKATKKRAVKQAKQVKQAQAIDFLESYAWRKLRYKVLKERGARCECCGRTPNDGARMNVDHIKPRRKHPELALTEPNLQILCNECNHGKGNWDETDWREPSLEVLMGEAIH